MFHQYLVDEVDKVREFVEKNLLPVRVEIARPNLSGNYLVSVLSGRTIFDFYDSGSSKCATNLKVTPINKLKKKIFKDFDKEKTISLLGLRFSESEHRKKNMLERGDRPDKAIRDKNDEWVQSPIAHFSDDDILMFLGYVRSGFIRGYSDFNRLVDLYRESAGGECLVNRMADQYNKKSACGSSRQGCWICLKVNDDKSMSNMLKLDEYAFMKPLADFRDFVKKTHYDLNRRCFLGRRLNKDGKNIKLRPSSYSPDHCEEMLKYALTIDADEREAAAAEKRNVRFELLSLSDVIACDILLNRYGYHRGLHACYLWRKICIFGERYYPPVMPAAPKVPIPPAISVPFVDDEYYNPFNGFRDVQMMVIDQESTVTKKDGRIYADCLTEQEFSIDSDSAIDFFTFELDYALDRYHDNSEPELISPTAAFHYLVRLGVVTFSRGGHSENDRMLRIANQVWRAGIRNVLNNPGELVRRLNEYHGVENSSS